MVTVRLKGGQTCATGPAEAGHYVRLEHLARGAEPWPVAAMTHVGEELDWRPMLASLIDSRAKGADCAALARGFHRALADGTAEVIDSLCEIHGVDTVVLSGGVMQNELFLSDLTAALSLRTLRIWTNREVPPNDGGISLGQAALAARSWCAPV